MPGRTSTAGVSPCDNPVMCGRFVQSQPASVYAGYFGVDSVVGESLSPSFNVAPTDEIYAVADDLIPG